MYTDIRNTENRNEDNLHILHGEERHFNRLLDVQKLGNEELRGFQRSPGIAQTVKPGNCSQERRTKDVYRNLVGATYR
jgi:hypothetical protein